METNNGISIRIPSSCKNAEGLMKLGELEFEISPKSSSMFGNIMSESYNTEEGFSCFLQGAYYCKSITDNTPLYNTVEKSRSIDIKNKMENIFIYFESNDARLKISNKYYCKGICTSRNYLSNQVLFKITDPNVFKYCQNWTEYPSLTTDSVEINIGAIKHRPIGAAYGMSGNFDGCTFSSGFNGTTELKGVNGEIKIGGGGNTVDLSGDFLAIMSSDTPRYPTSLFLKSPNVGGDFSYFNRETLQLGIGSSGKCEVVFGDGNFSVSRILKIYSDNITLPMLNKIIDKTIECTLNKDFIFEIYSDKLDIESIKVDSDLYNKLKQILSMTNQYVSINGYKIPRT